jgi:uncharacterized iron-regulated membrane protein
MKNMLIAATAVGATIAGLLLYWQRKEKGRPKVLDAASDAYHTMNNGLGKLERPAQHAMG